MFRKGIIILVAFAFVGFQDTKIPILNFEQFEPYLHQKNDTTYIINFWATWCKPCVEELPHFEQLNEKYKSEKVKVILVSLDFPKFYDKQLVPFVKKRGLKSQVILLDDPNSNQWINKVDSKWSGAIPATLIYSKKFREFHEKSFDFEELDSIVSLKTKIK